MNVLEAMETCTAMRYFKDEPVPKDVIEKLIYAATRASSPGNSQGWAFLVIDDPAIKESVGEKYCRGWRLSSPAVPPAKTALNNA